MSRDVTALPLTLAEAAFGAHLCDNWDSEATPRHLEAVTQAENIRRAQQVGYHPSAPTTCRNGHDWSLVPPLIWISSSGKTRRRCRLCAKAANDRRKRSA